MKGVAEERLGNFTNFLVAFIAELNQLSDEGWILLVEGPRDASAMKRLGYRGRAVTTGSVARGQTRSLGDKKKIIVMTDLDREGRQLAARFTKLLRHEGFETSLLERKRLLVASNGIFRQVENLARFAELVA